MSEEIRNPGTELNEAELTGASGGSSVKNPEATAWMLCASCEERGTPQCHGSEARLADYLRKSDGSQGCPFRSPR